MNTAWRASGYASTIIKFAFFVFSWTSVVYGEDSIYLGSIADCRECRVKKIIPYEKCVLVDNFLQPVGFLVSGSPKKNTFIRCESFQYRLAVYIPVNSELLSFGLIARFEFPTGVGGFPTFDGASLEGHSVPELFGRYTGFVGGLTAGVGGSGGVYSKKKISISSASLNVAGGFQMAASFIYINPYSPDSNGGQCSMSCITAVNGSDEASLNHFDPNDFKEWKFHYVGAPVDHCGTPGVSAAAAAL